MLKKAVSLAGGFLTLALAVLLAAALRFVCFEPDVIGQVLEKIP
ncbi:MAG: hypothetical protein Q4F17_02070 [Eubacteriales bacterium]|nr:hypothetical protein [Eubacteriales bacterium]